MTWNKHLWWSFSVTANSRQGRAVWPKSISRYLVRFWQFHGTWQYFFNTFISSFSVSPLTGQRVGNSYLCDVSTFFSLGPSNQTCGFNSVMNNVFCCRQKSADSCWNFFTGGKEKESEHLALGNMLHIKCGLPKCFLFTLSVLFLNWSLTPDTWNN